MLIRILLVFSILLPFWTGCDRPFIEPAAPDLEVVTPDLSEVLLDPETEIAIQASSFREVVEVRLNGQSLTYDAIADVWSGTLTLQRGANRVVIEATDEGDVAGRDTVFAVHLPARFDSRDAVGFVEPRGGHTATLMRDGRVLVVGGTRSASGSALGNAFWVEPDGREIDKLVTTLNVPRTGHTATLLPDGRLLILGGSTRDALIAEGGPIDALVETAELFDPETGAFVPVPVQATDPIRRTGHTALFFVLPDRAGNDEWFIYLYGGGGDIRYGTEPRWGVRGDLRPFRFRNDSLIAAGPTFGTQYEAISGHTQSPIDVSASDGLGRYLYSGTYFPPDATSFEDTETLAFQLQFLLGENIERDFLPVFNTPRTRHTAATSGDFVFFLGGRQFNNLEAIDETEVYVDAARMMVTFPASSVRMRTKRWGHTATKLRNGRILVLGGFDADGSAVRLSEWFDPVPTSNSPHTPPKQRSVK